MTKPTYDRGDTKPGACRDCTAWYAEYQRASLLLELLAEDRFPDQESFDAWINTQMTLALRRTPTGGRDARD